MKSVAVSPKETTTTALPESKGIATANPLQLKTHPLQRQQNPLQLVKETVKSGGNSLQRKQNTTGLPDTLKSGIENLSGYSMDDVQVHYNSPKPAQLQAHAYAQGTEIHLAPGQEKHLPHEAWHVVQQKQGRVRPTVQLKSRVGINSDKALEKEADAMGVKAALRPTEQISRQMGESKSKSDITQTIQQQVVQRVIINFKGININVRNDNGYPTWTWTDGKQYHINYGGGGTKHVTVDGERTHFFFTTDIVGSNWVIKSAKPTKAERGNRKKDTKKSFDELPLDLQIFIETNYQAIMDE